MSHEKEVQQLIDADNLNKISDFITKSGNSDFVKKRQSVMIALMAFSGARPSELECLTIDCIKCSPHLSLTTIKIPIDKFGANGFRLVTIPSTFAMELQKYIGIDRYRIISKTCWEKNDYKVLLINEKTGLRLRSRDLSQEISKIFKATGIDLRIRANLFRQDSSLFTHKLNSLNSDKIYEYELSKADRSQHVNRHMSKYYDNCPPEVVIDLHLLDTINPI